MMSLITALEITNNYPDQLLIDSGQDKSTGKHAGYLYRLKGERIHKLMLSTNASFDNSEGAKTYIDEVCKEAIRYIKTLKPTV